MTCYNIVKLFEHSTSVLVTNLPVNARIFRCIAFVGYDKLQDILYISVAMEQFFTLPYFVLEVPNVKIKRPSWLHQPSSTAVFAVVLVSYFLVTGGTAILDIGIHKTVSIYFTFNSRYHI